jgi:hypothetical protein
LAYLSCNAKRFTLLPLEDLRMHSDNESAFFADASAVGVSLRAPRLHAGTELGLGGGGQVPGKIHRNEAAGASLFGGLASWAGRLGLVGHF